mmetsp:Transcript_21022/g.58417  ORF Transcript_21022/g.58417 Transcript_21022/m.58417 type:complete len:260 (+) Transcript_21022:297-1076(+)
MMIQIGFSCNDTDGSIPFHPTTQIGFSNDDTDGSVRSYDALQLLGVHEGIVDEGKRRQPLSLACLAFYLEEDSPSLHLPVVLCCIRQDCLLAVKHHHFLGIRQLQLGVGFFATACNLIPHSSGELAHELRMQVRGHARLAGGQHLVVGALHQPALHLQDMRHLGQGLRLRCDELELGVELSHPVLDQQPQQVQALQSGFLRAGGQLTPCVLIKNFELHKSAFHGCLVLLLDTHTACMLEGFTCQCKLLLSCWGWLIHRR